MYNPNIFFKRFYAGIIAGNGLIHKIKAAFGLVFISFISPVSLYLKKFNKNYKAHFISGSDVAMWVEVFFDEEYKLPDNLYSSSKNTSTHIATSEPEIKCAL